ncbi:hypothetical protein DVH05_012970 [Phytophthora capsici]|nr:hypothetical protein DVH05_012970 [Phytophthora capsici]
MEDGHKEEQQDAIPVDTERRTSSQRHRILPMGTVVQDGSKKILSTHSVVSPDVAAFDSKVHPGERGLDGSGGSSDKNFFKTEIATATEILVQVDMKLFPLRFRDPTQEEAFCKHFNMYVTGKVRSASRIMILVHAIMLIAQYLTQAQVHHNFVFVTRAAAILLSLFFQTMISTSWFRRHLERLLLVHYLALDVVHQLPRFAFLMSSIEEENDQAATDENKIEELTLFASQKSVRAMNLIFIVVIYIASGMRFNMATICVCWHIAIKFFFAVAFCHTCTWDDLDATTNCAMIAFCTLTAYHGERYVRQEFVVRLKVDEERKRRDDLLETMLPVHIKERLKDNCTDGLVESYDEVSILFCYVSNFQALSKNASAIELVQLMNRIVFCFDSATDAHEVYKVEAIAETYMCAAGVPKRDPLHCEKVAEMALTMMRICEKESWNFDGVDIQLQIGIHSGPVVAGVVGSKTYSYHLFGDTVNTSSRVCSSGCAGKIQISARSHQLLAQNGSFVISERGLVNLKGKGMVQLFWLEGKATLVSRRKHAVPEIYNDFETVMEESIHAKDLEYKSPLHHRSDVYLRCMKDVEIQRVTLDFRQKIPCNMKNNG